MKKRKKLLNNTCEILFFLYCVAVCLSDVIIPVDLSWLPFDISFSFKPFMAMTLVIFIYILSHKINVFKYMTKLDLALGAFALIGTMELVTSYDGAMTARYLFGLLVVLFSYVCVKTIAMQIKFDDLARIIVAAGILMLSLTLMYYFIGLCSLHFNFHGNNILSYGVLLDRNFPRLISLASNDPNITALILSFFTFFFLHDAEKRKSRLSKIGFVLSALIMLLTLSRGAITALVVSILFYLIHSLKRGTAKTTLSLIGVLLLAGIILFIFDLATDSFLLNNIFLRFSNTTNDGGSGRLELWSVAIGIFRTHPITGIGLNNTLAYSGLGITHNTFLQVLSEMGIVGFLSFAGVLFITIKDAAASDKANHSATFLPLLLCTFIQMAFLCALLENVFFLLIAMLEASLFPSRQQAAQKRLEWRQYDRAEE